MDLVWGSSSIIQTGIGALLGVIGAVGLLPTAIGDKLLGHIFDRKLNDLKHEQDTKIESLRTRLGVVGDRGVRANEREFLALTAAWDAFISAFILTKACLISFISYPDFSKMNDEQAKAFLNSTDLSESQRDQVMEASDRANIFNRIVRFRQIGEAGRSIFDAREVIRKQGIFMQDVIEEEFEAALDMCSSAQVQESMRFDFGKEAGLDQRTKFMKIGDSTALSLKNTVRNRLMHFGGAELPHE